MSDSQLACTDEGRRRDVRAAPGWNGLDYLEVGEDQLTLTVYFIDKAPENIGKANIQIRGGRRVRDIQVVGLRFCRQDDPERDDCMIVTVDKPGDFSPYTLCLVELGPDGRPTGQPLAGIDPRYACLEFSFAVDCPSDLDCGQEPACPTPERPVPEINYLAKDYASFRQLIYDRLALIMPGWADRHVPDLGVTLVEVLAYAGDQLSYYQDAVASEAYLDTARLRTSVRRHVRLLDYPMHEGCNARALVCVKIEEAEALSIDPQQTGFITRYLDEPPDGKPLTPDDLLDVPASRYEVFQPLLPPPPAPGFGPNDLKSAACLAVKLRDGRDPLSAYLRSRLSPHTQELLEAYQGDGSSPLAVSFAATLVSELDQLVRGPSLYERSRFKEVDLRGATLELLESDPQGADLVQLNRMLLEDAYPQEIARRRAPGEPVTLYAAHNQLRFYTWGDDRCCLPRGATSATLRDEWQEPEGEVPPPYQQQYPVDKPKGKPPWGGPPGEKPPAERPCDRLRALANLQPGDVLILKEVISPTTGLPEDADLAHRQAVRLTRVEFAVDALYDPPVPVVAIEWADQDALEFPLCISAISDPPACQPLEDVSLACGNMLLVDHGRPVWDEPLGDVPLARTEAQCEDPCHPAEETRWPGRFRPTLAQTPLTFAAPLAAGAPAAGLLHQDPRRAMPAITLISTTPEARPFTHEDIVDFPGLVERVRQAANPPEQLLKNSLPAEARQLLEEGEEAEDGGALLAVLLEAFNQQLDNRGLYDQGGFAELRLSPEAAGLAAHGPRASRLVRLLNRWLLEEAFPDEIRPGSRHFQAWEPRRDLLGSAAQDAHFVVELEADGRAYLRFGDGDLGRRPAAETRFWANYRTGTEGNVGAGVITALLSWGEALGGASLWPRNPLPAQGGQPPEPLAEVKLFAPHAFRAELARAVTASDYAAIVQRDFSERVQRAAATLRWTGSRYVVWVAVDPRGALEADPGLLEEIVAHLERYRRIGHDLLVAPARYVPLEIDLEVCVLPGYLRGHVRAALLEAFSNRRNPSGRLGFFHPDNQTFGEGVYLSRLVAVAQALPGVESVRLTRFERFGEGPNGELESGLLPLGPLEVAQLDNDPGFRENGTLELYLRGGR